MTSTPASWALAAADPQPAPFSSADVGKALEGLETRDAGTVVAVDERYGRGGGVLTIRPHSEADEFVTSDEAFTVADVRKAEFTPVLADCVDVATGQQTTVEVGGLPSEPQLASAAFLSRERLVRILVAINDPAQAQEVAPAAGATSTTAPTAPAFPSGATATGRRRQRRLPLGDLALGRWRRWRRRQR